MKITVIGEIHRLQQMTVGELQIEWQRLYGEATRSRNRDYLWKRLAWRVQELAHGGLTDRARQRIEELPPDSFVRARTPAHGAHVADPAPVEKPRRPARDPRLPSPGTVIVKQYKGTELRVVVRDDGIEHEGAMYASFTTLAKHVTGSKSINGKLFFGLTERKR